MTPEDIEYIVIHCSDTPPSYEATAEIIKEWHTSPPRNWRDIGYHFVIRRDGMTEVGRGLDVEGAHVRGYNGRSWGICLVGGRRAKVGGGENNFTADQFEALSVVVKELLEQAPNAKVIGHRDLDDKKYCPSFEVKDWITGGGLD